MTTLILLTFATVALGIAIAAWRGRREAAAAPTANPRPSRPTAPARMPRKLDALQWTEPGAVEVPRPLEGTPLRARIRDRYIAARFPGMFRSGADLLELENVVRVARLLFEEGHVDSAHEVFALAIEQSPGDRGLRLAQIEIAYLTQDPERFAELARAFSDSFPDAPEWAEVVRLGYALCPDDPLFRDAARDRDSERYGPWPEMPNWIQASWDLTAEVLGAQFHRVMRAPAQPAAMAATSHAIAELP